MVAESKIPTADAESWNACRFPGSGSGSGHVESYFCKLNSPDNRRALWLKATLRVPVAADRESVAESWAIVFERGRPPRAAKQVVPLRAARFSDVGLDLAVADLFWRTGKISGGVGHAGGREILFDLRSRDVQAPLAPLPATFYAGSFPRFKFVSPSPDARFDGNYVVDGERVDVSDWRGMQGHNWGRGHTYRYAWGHCNQWDDVPAEDTLFFEGATAQIKLGPIVAPPVTLLAVGHRGVRHVFNTPLDLLRARGRHDMRRWSFSAENRLARVSGHLEAAGPEFAGLLYENPTGPPAHCLNSKLAQGELHLEVRGHSPIVARTRSAALEIGTQSTDHGVIVLV